MTLRCVRWVIAHAGHTHAHTHTHAGHTHAHTHTKWSCIVSNVASQRRDGVENFGWFNIIWNKSKLHEIRNTFKC